jgi:hypothetical protein
MDNAEISRITGYSSWIVKCSKEKSGHYSLEELAYMLKMVRWAEMSIKTGDIPEELAVEYILVNIFS